MSVAPLRRCAGAPGTGPRRRPANDVGDARALPRPARAAVGLTAALSVALLWSEWHSARRSRAGFAPSVPAQRPVPDAVLVLGFPSGGALATSMQRWRTDIAVRTAGPQSVLVFSGGAKDAGRCEAEVMAADAVARHGTSRDRIRLETRARTTWQNVELSLPHLRRARSIAVASSPVHAARARQYLARQDEALAARLVPARDHVVGERTLLKLLTVLHAAVQRWRAPTRPRPDGRAALDLHRHA